MKSGDKKRLWQLPQAFFVKRKPRDSRVVEKRLLPMSGSKQRVNEGFM